MATFPKQALIDSYQPIGSCMSIPLSSSVRNQSANNTNSGHSAKNDDETGARYMETFSTLDQTTTASPAAERRDRERFGVEGFAEATVPGSKVLFRGNTQDLSQTGCYIRTKAFLSADIGEEVELRLSVDELHFKTSARVRAVRRGRGAGFEFLGIDEEAREGIDALIAKLSGPRPS
jgi:hypothetical protein